MKDFLNKMVIIRTYSAGVHFGMLESLEQKEAVLKNSRRIWSWQGALTLNEIAENGLDLGKSVISEPVSLILLTEVIEVIIINKKSNIYQIKEKK